MKMTEGQAGELRMPPHSADLGVHSQTTRAAPTPPEEGSSHQATWKGGQSGTELSIKNYKVYNKARKLQNLSPAV